MAGVIVIGYDGSPNAARAIEFAAGITGAAAAVVVTAWTLPTAVVQTPVAPAGGPPIPSLEEDREGEQRARRTAEEGAVRARAAGLDAESVFQRATGTTGIATMLFDIAEQRDAALVVVGRRGMSRIKSIVLGSVSDAAMRDGRRPVLVVPAVES